MSPEQRVGRERGLEGLGWGQIMAAPENSATTPPPTHSRTQAPRRLLFPAHSVTRPVRFMTPWSAEEGRLASRSD